MTRKDCEKKLLEKLEESWAIYRKYHPKGEYLDMCALVTDEGELVLQGNNQYYDVDKNNPIEFSERKKNA